MIVLKGVFRNLHTLFYTVFASIYLFSPYQIGESHVACDYFYIPIHNQKGYISDEYISSATGNFCETYSEYIKGENGLEYIVCIDYATRNHVKSE